MSGSSTASFHARTNTTTPGPHEPSAALRTTIPISAPSVHPWRNGNPIGAPQRRPERLHAPPHTPAYAARGTQGYEARTTEVNVATAPPTVAKQALPGDPDAACAAPPMWTTVQARNDPSNAMSTTDENMTESWGSGTSGTTPPAAAHPSPTALAIWALRGKHAHRA